MTFIKCTRLIIKYMGSKYSVSTWWACWGATLISVMAFDRKAWDVFNSCSHLLFCRHNHEPSFWRGAIASHISTVREGEGPIKRGSRRISFDGIFLMIDQTSNYLFLLWETFCKYIDDISSPECFLARPTLNQWPRGFINCQVVSTANFTLNPNSTKDRDDDHGW